MSSELLEGTFDNGGFKVRRLKSGRVRTSNLRKEQHRAQDWKQATSRQGDEIASTTSNLSSTESITIKLHNHHHGKRRHSKTQQAVFD
jgi:hypothetical protein